MKWILTQDKLPDKQCNEIFCTIKDINGVSKTTVEKYYPFKTIIYKDSSYSVTGNGFGTVCVEDSCMYFSHVTPIAWSYIPNFDSDEWLNPESCLANDKPCEVLVLREIDGQKYVDYADYKSLTFKVWDDEQLQYQKINDVIGWIKYPEPFRFRKPKKEELKISARSFSQKVQDHFVESVEGRNKANFFKEIENMAKETPISKKIYVYELGFRSPCFCDYEVEIVDNNSKPKDYFDGRTDFQVQGRKLTVGKFLDSETFNKVLFGNYAIINKVIYPREEAISVLGDDEVDIKIMEWLNIKQLEDYLRPSRYRNPVNEKVKELFAKQLKHD